MSTVILGKNEAIVIGNEFIVTVLAVRGDEVEIGIERARGVPVEREEACAAVCQATGSPGFWS